MNHKKFPNYIRTNSICPSPETILLDAVKRNDITTIQTFLYENPQLLSHTYDHPYNKTILLIACKESGIKPETINCLIECGDGDNLNECDDNQWNPLHLATAESDNPDILETIIKHLQPGQINDLAEGDNALHILIKYYDNNKENEFIKKAQLLIRAGINVNQGDEKNLSPILLAAKKNSKMMVATILDNSIAHVDLDTHKFKGKSARQLIKEKNLYTKPLPEKNQISNNNPKQILFNYLKEYKEDEFIIFIDNFPELINSDDGNLTLLQISCEKGLKKIVQHLINKGVNINTVINEKYLKPFDLAAECGYYEIIRILLDHPDVEITSQTLCHLLKYINSDKLGMINHEKCYELIMNKIKTNQLLVDLNSEDEGGNTPLHYAIRYAGQEKSEELLNLGASLACTNRFNKMPIEDIEPSILHNHLDNCIKFDMKNKNFDKQEFEIIFDYKTLMPPKKKCFKYKLKYDQNDCENCPNFENSFIKETQLIAYMSGAPEFKNLLKHPVIVSFLFIKWHRIRWLFYTNLSFYIIFVLSLATYIFSYYSNFIKDGQTSALHLSIIHLSWLLLVITFILLILRETFQMAISWNYLRNFENYIELFLIIVTAMILLIQSPSNDTRKQLSSIAILLAAFELVLMLGQHPQLSTNVVMLKTVSLNFFKLLSWYSLLIIAFALSFNILFSKTTIPNRNSTLIITNNINNENDDNDDDLFTGPGTSIFKTIVMLTGEFDASSINFHTFPITSKIIFSLFVFMITIILLNLLNGLAVSDTQTIKNEAQLVSLIARAQHIYYVESMILGNIIPISLLKFIKNLFCCCPTIDLDISYTFTKPLLAKSVCMFNYLNNYELTVLPNCYGQIYLNNNLHKNRKGFPNCCNIPLFLNKETNKKINEIVLERRNCLKNNNNEDIFKLYKKIMAIESKQIDICAKLEAILQKIQH